MLKSPTTQKTTGYQPGPAIYATLPDRQTVDVYPLFELVKRTCGEHPAGVEQPLRGQLDDMSDLCRQFTYFLSLPEEQRRYADFQQFNRLVINMGCAFEEMMLSVPEDI